MNTEEQQQKENEFEEKMKLIRRKVKYNETRRRYYRDIMMGRRPVPPFMKDKIPKYKIIEEKERLLKNWSCVVYF